jgi:hypothetical protein
MVLHASKAQGHKIRSEPVVSPMRGIKFKIGFTMATSLSLSTHVVAHVSTLNFNNFRTRSFFHHMPMAFAISSAIYKEIICVFFTLYFGSV